LCVNIGAGGTDVAAAIAECHVRQHRARALCLIPFDRVEILRRRSVVRAGAAGTCRENVSAFIETCGIRYDSTGARGSDTLAAVPEGDVIDRRAEADCDSVAAVIDRFAVRYQTTEDPDSAVLGRGAQIYSLGRDGCVACDAEGLNLFDEGVFVQRNCSESHPSNGSVEHSGIPTGTFDPETVAARSARRCRISSTNGWADDREAIQVDGDVVCPDEYGSGVGVGNGEITR